MFNWKRPIGLPYKQSELPQEYGASDSLSVNINYPLQVRTR